MNLKYFYYFILSSLAVLLLVSCGNPLGDNDQLSDEFNPSAGSGSGPDTEAPTAPSAVTTSGLGTSATTKTFTWSASSDNVGVNYYSVALGTGITGAAQSDLFSWTNVGLVTSYQISGLSLSSGTDYYFSVIAYDAAGNASSAKIFNYSYFEPTDLSDLVLWLDLLDSTTLFSNTGCTSAASTGGNLQCIQDKSGRNNHFTRDSGSPQLQSSIINGKNALVLANGDRFETPNTTDINDGDRSYQSHYTVIRTDSDVTTQQMIYKEGGTTNGAAFFIQGGQFYIGIWIDQSTNSSDRSWVNFPVTADTTYIIGYSMDDSIDSFTASVNGTAVTQAALGGQKLKSHTGNIALGTTDAAIRDEAGNSDQAAATIPYIGGNIIYNAALDANQQEMIEGYLACKFDIQSVLPSSHSYKSTCP